LKGRSGKWNDNMLGVFLYCANVSQLNGFRHLYQVEAFDA
jgi:hypothetical protein